MGLHIMVHHIMDMGLHIMDMGLHIMVHHIMDMGLHITNHMVNLVFYFLDRSIGVLIMHVIRNLNQQWISKWIRVPETRLAVH
jgi:predicted naringenin-chalcone synthase